MVYRWVISFQYLLLFLLILLYKPQKDCLQGISLLDYKFKTSSFQLYKDQSLNAQKSFRLGFLRQVSEVIDMTESDIPNERLVALREEFRSRSSHQNMLMIPTQTQTNTHTALDDTFVTSIF